MARLATTPDPSTAYLFRRLGVLESKVRDAVAARRVTDPEPDDRFRGLYISDAHVDRILDGPRESLADPSPSGPTSDVAEANEFEQDSSTTRLLSLARNFGLKPIDVELLLVALAPDLDPRFEQLYAYLNDDVSRRRATIGLALELCGVPFGTGMARARFNTSGPLLGGALMIVEESERPFLTRSLRVPDRVIAHLLGDDATDPLVAQVVTNWTDTDIGDVGPLARALRSGVLCYVQEHTGAAGATFAAAALRGAGFLCIALDLERLDGGDDVRTIASTAAREALFRGGGLVVRPIDAIAERGASAVRAFAEGRCPTILVGARVWDPGWSREVPLVVEAPFPTVDDRMRVWRQTLDGHLLNGLDPTRETAQFRMTPEQVVRASRVAIRRAEAVGGPLSVADLHAGARAQNAAGLERLARRIEPRAAWEDLVVPQDVLVQLRELTARARFRDRVLDEWQMGRPSSKGRGITALFAGESGTGKTMSAEIVARDLGLDLYVIDLSTVVDKYIGETEKNLDRIFREADRINGVLLFDEADAIFGKRSEVSDAHDRYANLEIAFLLQRMERFDGLAILTTNLRSNLDEAFTRRLDAIIDFRMPEENHRLCLWQINLSSSLPTSNDIDAEFLAKSFKLSGGNIRNIVLAGAYLAAEEETSVGMSHVIRATAREYQKLGRLRVQDEFGPYYALLG